MSRRADPPPERAAGGLERVADEVWRIELPTPWHVGSVSVYLIEDEPLTLIDTGPLWSVALAALEGALAAVDRRVEEIERVILTHQHLDHAGQASTLVRRSGAELLALAGVVDWLREYPAGLRAEDEYAERIMRRHGASSRAIAEVRAHNASAHDYGAPAQVTRPLRDGEHVSFARRRLRVWHRPGHSPSDTVFHDEARRMLFGGDLLLPAFASSPLIMPPLDGSTPSRRPPAAAQHVESLRETEKMDLELVLPGHGAPISSPRRLIAERLRAYDRSTERVAGLLSDRPRTASEMVLALRRRDPGDLMFFQLCEVLGHLDRLCAAGAAAERVDADGLARFTRQPAR